MPLERLRVVSFRNLSDQSLVFSKEINVLFGCNGSGKTSLLEAIYLLSLGKSFRTQRLSATIQHGCEASAVEGWVGETSLMLQKKQGKKTDFFVANQPIHSAAELARLLPIQLLSLQGYQLLNAPPEMRRKFLDWIMFHVEPHFLKIWQDYHRVLRQRNAVLRDKRYLNNEEYGYWTEKLGTLGDELHHAREKVLKGCLAFSKNYCETMPGVRDLGLEYEPGWDIKVSDFKTHLVEGRQQDLALGYTRKGPHRADLKITLGGDLAQQLLSTGQQKTFVAALQLAQTQWVAEQTGCQPLLLIDDLPSELDNNARTKLSETLRGLNSQVFITSVEKESFGSLFGDAPRKMFHVEQGIIAEVG